MVPTPENGHFIDCIINGNHDYLLEFLEGLAVPEHSATIQDWDTAGKVYLDYIRITNTLRAVQQVGWSPRVATRGRPLTSLVAFQVESGGADGYELERLHAQVTSLCDRIQLLPCEGARDRLAQSGSKSVCVFLFIFLKRCHFLRVRMVERAFE